MRRACTTSGNAHATSFAFLLLMWTFWNDLWARATFGTIMAMSAFLSMASADCHDDGRDEQDGCRQNSKVQFGVDNKYDNVYG